MSKAVQDGIAERGKLGELLESSAVEVRQESVVVETDRYRVEGKLTLPSEGYRSRLSDQINRRDQEFFTVTDAQLVSLDGSGRDWNAPVLMLARRHIRLIVPLDGDE